MGLCDSASHKLYLAVPRGDKHPQLLDHLQADQIYSAHAKGGSLHRVAPSLFQDILDHTRKNNTFFYDEKFPPQESSLGATLPNREEVRWLRIKDICKSPRLIYEPFSPAKSISQHQDYCYLISAMVTLAGRPLIPKLVFPQSEYLQEGVYAVRLLLGGQIREIVVDDHFPTNNKGEPFFVHPVQGEFWPLVLEKAWAKWHGSYQAILYGLPNDVLRAISYAPTFMHPVESQPEKSRKLWEQLRIARAKKYPVCCSSCHNQEMDQGLENGLSYVFLDAYEGVECSYGSNCKVVKLHDPWGRVPWHGRLSPGDNKFYREVKTSSPKQTTQLKALRSNDFLLLFDDFLKYFQLVDICHLQDNYSHYAVELEVSRKHARYVTFQTKLKADAYLTASQLPRKEGLSMITLIVGKVQGENYTYIDAVTGDKTADLVLKLPELEPGTYVVYCRAFWKEEPIQKAVLSIYSEIPVKLSEVFSESKAKYKPFLSKVLASHAVQKPMGNIYPTDNKQDWISCKILIRECGLAYIVVNVSADSKNTFEVQFEERCFTEAGYRLLKPHRGRRGGVEVGPGSQAVVVARVEQRQGEFIFPPAGVKFLNLSK